MNTVFRKIAMAVLMVSLVLAGMPLSSAYAAAPASTSSALPNPQRINTRLERPFARQTQKLKRVAKLYKQFDQGFPKIQSRIEKAKGLGLDVTQAQAAFDAFKKALTDARPLYDQAKIIADMHKGFDANGKVIDPAAARETIKGIRESGKQFKDAMNGTLKALHQAIKALRETRRAPTPTPGG